MARVKGGLILNGRDYAVASAGEEAWMRAVALLDGPDRSALAEVIPVGWYDIRLYDHVNRALARALGDGGEGEDVMVAAGRFAAEHDLRTIHRMFLRLANPAYVIERSSSFWARFQDSGTWTIERQGPTRVRATLAEWGAEDELTCIRLAAYMGRLFELVGATDVHVGRLACRSRGDAACIFQGSWA